MRILFVTPSYPPCFIGGGSTMAKMLTEGLIRRGHEVTILTGCLSACRETEFITSSVDIVHLPYMFANHMKLLNPSIIEYLPPAPRRLKITLHEIMSRIYDVVHIFAFPLHTMTDIIMLIINHTNLVVTIHGFPTFLTIKSRYLKQLLRQYYKVYFRYIGRKLINKAKIVTTVSKHVALQAIQNGIPASKIRIIPNAIDYDYYERIRNSMKKQDSSENTIVSVGRIIPIKGYEYAIKAVYALKREYGLKNLKYIIIGPIGNIEYYLNLRILVEKLNLKHNIEFKGPVYSKDELSKLILNSDIYLSPSLYETFGISVLEAMALGKPIVATDVPGHREIIKPGYTGLLVTSKDYNALANAVARLLQDESLRKAMSQNALREVKKYDIKLVASLYEKAYYEFIHQI